MPTDRSSLQELCEIIEAKPAAVLGKKFFDTRLVCQLEASTKGDKYDHRFLVISKFRFFLLSGKSANSLKVERSYHILAVRSMSVLSEHELAVAVEEGGARKRLLLRGHAAEPLAIALLHTLRHYFPDMAPHVARHVELTPAALAAHAAEIRVHVTPRPCHSFRRTYAACCDLYDQPYRDEVAWDVEKIYTANGIRDLRLDDFSHLLPKDLIPIVATLQYSTYFEGLVLDGMQRLSVEMLETLAGVVRRASRSLRRLQLAGCGLPRDFPALLAAAIAEAEGESVLELLDLSRNAGMDERKGFAALCSALGKLQRLKEIRVSECALSEKSAAALAAALYARASSGGDGGLVALRLDGNGMRDDVSSLTNLLSLSTSLRVLNLTDCGAPLDKLWAPLKYGCLQLEELLLAGSVASLGKKATPEVASAAKDFFAASVGLRELDLSRVQMSPELLRAILTGLATNNQIAPLSLTLDGASCADKSGSAALGGVLEECLPAVKAHALSLRDCNLDGELAGVLAAIGHMKELKSLSIGGANVANLKRNAKHTHLIGKAVSELVKLVTGNTELESLSLAEARLGQAHAALLINSLGAVTTLRTLDLTANDLGNFAARILGKALAINCSLRTLLYDGNHTGADGLSELAAAMEYNLSLTAFPCPFVDIAEALQKGERVKASAAWARIESALERNRSHARVSDAAWRRVGGRRGRDRVAAADAAPPEMDATLEAFVAGVQREAAEWVRAATNREGSEKARKEAMERMREVVKRDVAASLEEWCWRELVGEKEKGGGEAAGAASRLERGRVLSGNNGTPASDRRGGEAVPTRSGTPLSECASPSPMCRPRSILTTEARRDSTESAGGGGSSEKSTPAHVNHHAASASAAGGGEGSALDLLAPPQPSKLSHPNKARPKPLRRRIVQACASPVPSLVASSYVGEEAGGGEDEEARGSDSPTDSAGSSGVENRGPDGVQSLLQRSAILPPAEGWILTSSLTGGECSPPSASPAPLTTREQGGGGGGESPPPPLPLKRQVAPPPSLPPKPEKPEKLLREASRDESPAGGVRRSVADMARLFSK